MARRFFRRAILIPILFLVGCVIAFIAWYAVAANYDYGALAGTYVFHDGDERCVLHLHVDRTFSQQLVTGNHMQVAKGDWRRFGESGIALSATFLKLPRQELGHSGETYGSFYKTLGILPYLRLDPDPGGPVFRRTWTRWRSGTGHSESLP
jgi:hypothetical protein